MSARSGLSSASVTSLLGGLADHDRETIELRIERWWPDLIAALTLLYPEGPDRDPAVAPVSGAAVGVTQAEELAARLVGRAIDAFRQRDPELRRLDQRRLLTPDWLQQPDRFGYACYTERFGQTLAGLPEHLDYLKDLGVNYLHLMPLLRPRPGDNDGGYAVQSYRDVRADLGDVDDLRALATTLRGEGITLVLDLVLNHVAREHEWAAKARAGDPRYRRYFHIYPDRRAPDAYERTLPEVFPDFAPGSFTLDEELGEWVWTTFNEWQWDLNWSNPEVLVEYADIVLYLANLGVEVLRLDAIAFTWKRLGTNCQNQPEVHALTQALRALARMACPATAFKAEAIVGPRDLVPYLGQGPHAGRVSDLAYHNSLMVQIWSMLATGDVVLARQALAALPPTPSSATWICYLRCHDDIGWAIDDGDAAAVGLNGHAHRRFLSDWFCGEHPGTWADGLVFQANPISGDRRISGTAASLLGLSEHGADASDDAALRRLFLASAIVCGWGGIPVIWSGDELGMCNDPLWADEAGHEDDNRWAHRPRLDWQRAGQRHDGQQAAGRVFEGVAHLARVRAGLPQLHAAATSTVLMHTDAGVLGVVRTHPSGPMVCVYNVTDSWRSFPYHHFAEAGINDPHNAIENLDVHVGDDGRVALSPYSAWWVVDGAAPSR